MCRQCQVFGHVAIGSAGKRLKECVKSHDTKIGRGRRNQVDKHSFRDDWRKGMKMKSVKHVRGQTNKAKYVERL